MVSPMSRVNSLVSADIGNTLTNIQTWNGIMYNVLQNGLIGDGTIDDTVALQTLINTAILAGRKAIFFPHTTTGGEYFVTALTNADQVVFFGDNASFVGGYVNRIWQIGNDDLFESNFMLRQALINGNFDVWQRGTSFTNPTSFQYTTDRWKASPSYDGGTPPTNIIHSRQPLTPGDLSGSYYHYRIAPDGAGSSYGVNASNDIRQTIEYGTRYLCGTGKKVNVSFWARSSIVGKRVGVSAIQNYGTGGSPTAQEVKTGGIFALTSTWQKFTYTFTTNTIAGKTFGTNNDDAFNILLTVLWGTTTATLRFGGGTAETFVGAGNIDIAQVQVNAGDQSLPFQPRSFADELQLCQRFYEKSYNVDVDPATNSSAGSIAWVSRTADTLDYVSIPFKVSKRIQPTVTIYNPTTGATGQARNITSGGTLAVAPSAVGKQGYLLSMSAATTANNQYHFQFSADAEL